MSNSRKREPSLKKSERVLNEAQETVRTLTLALRDKESEIEKQEKRVMAAIKAGDAAKEKRETNILINLRRECSSIESRLERLNEGKLVFQDTLGEFQTQKHLRNMSDETTQLFKTSDTAGMVEAGAQTDWHTEGLLELRAMTGASEEKQAQRNEENERVRAELRARMQQSEDATESTTASATTTAVARNPLVNTNGAVVGGGKRQATTTAPKGKYSEADKLLTFL